MIVDNVVSGGSICTSHTFAFWIVLSSLPFYYGWLQLAARAYDLHEIIQSESRAGDWILAFSLRL